MKKIGIMGGTFNPPHVGHLLMANEVLQALDLDEVRFMPNAIPPHKEEPNGATGEQRLHMTALAIEDHAKFKLEPYEIQKGGTSYSFETLQVLKEREPDCDFYFIIGGDMVDSLHTWYRIEDLLTLVHFVGVDRPGTEGKSELPVIHVAAPIIDVSSTLLRKRLKNNQSVRYLLPQKVEHYIRKEGLYGTTTATRSH